MHCNKIQNFATLPAGGQSFETSLESLQVTSAARENVRWDQSVKSLLCQLVSQGATDRFRGGLNLLIDSDHQYGGIPVGVGLSSSGALGVSISLAFKGLFDCSHWGDLDVVRAVVGAESNLGFLTGIQDPMGCLQDCSGSFFDRPTLSFIECRPVDLSGQREPSFRVESVPFPKGILPFVVNLKGRQWTAKGRNKHNIWLAEGELLSIILQEKILGRIAPYCESFSIHSSV